MNPPNCLPQTKTPAGGDIIVARLYSFNKTPGGGDIFSIFIKHYFLHLKCSIQLNKIIQFNQYIVNIMSPLRGLGDNRNSALQICHPSGVREKKEIQCYNYATLPGFHSEFRNSNFVLNSIDKSFILDSCTAARIREEIFTFKFVI